MISTSRAYNALTGQEIKKAILSEVEQALDRAGLVSAGITYPGASWSWSLDIRQKDMEGRPVGDTPERHIEAGAEPSKTDKLISALTGGSKRFRHNPPSPTEVRQTEGLPVPEA